MTARSAYAVLLVALFACASAPDAEAPIERLVNGSFEHGRDPWFDFQRPEKPYWGSFDISDARAFDGRHSLRLQLDSERFPGSIGIAGAAQDVAVQVMPRRLRGHYWVEHWQRGTRAQYIQLVVMAFGASNFQDLKASAQAAFVLAGVDSPPFEIANRRFAFAGPVEPETGRWVAFEIDLPAEFERLWGRVPEAMRQIRVFAELRFDGLARERDTRVLATVYFDALQLSD